jgi:DNA-binding protein HU-beta
MGFSGLCIGLMVTNDFGMNRAALIDFVQKGMGKEASRAVADRAVSLVIEGIKTGLKKDKSVQLIGFGTFKVIERKARMGVNPKTLDKIKIKKSRTVKLAVGKDLKSRL